MVTADLKAPLGAAIKAERSALGISQEELASRAGLDRAKSFVNFDRQKPYSYLLSPNRHIVLSTIADCHSWSVERLNRCFARLWR